MFRTPRTLKVAAALFVSALGIRAAHAACTTGVCVEWNEPTKRFAVSNAPATPVVGGELNFPTASISLNVDYPGDAGAAHPFVLTTSSVGGPDAGGTNFITPLTGSAFISAAALPAWFYYQSTAERCAGGLVVVANGGADAGPIPDAGRPPECFAGTTDGGSSGTSDAGESSSSSSSGGASSSGSPGMVATPPSGSIVQKSSPEASDCSIGTFGQALAPGAMAFLGLGLLVRRRAKKKG